MRTLRMEVGGLRKTETPKFRWSEVIRKYTKEKRVQREEAQYQGTWRLKTLRATPNMEKTEEEDVMLAAMTSYVTCHEIGIICHVSGVVCLVCDVIFQVSMLSASHMIFSSLLVTFIDLAVVDSL